MNICENSIGDKATDIANFSYLLPMFIITENTKFLKKDKNVPIAGSVSSVLKPPHFKNLWDIRLLF